MAFQGMAATVPQIEVDVDNVATPAGRFDMKLTVQPPAFSTVRELEKALQKGGDVETLRQLISDEEAIASVKGWDGDGFRDKTGELLPCSPEQIKAALADIPGFYHVILNALVAGYYTALLKNLPASSATTSAAARGSAKRAK